MSDANRVTATAHRDRTVVAWLDALHDTYDVLPPPPPPPDLPSIPDEPDGYWRHPQSPSYRPRLATICRWCMERTVTPDRYGRRYGPVFYTLDHPHFAYLCEQCRLDVRMFIQRLGLHRAMTPLQATDAVMRLIDLAYERQP